MTRTLFITCLLLVLLAAKVSAQMQTRDIAELGLPYITRYTTQEYHAAPDNWDIAQDNDGIIYVGNTDGILEYDGAYWRLIKTPGGTPVKSLTSDSHGRVYVGAVGDVGYLEPGPNHGMVYHSLLGELDSADRSAFTNVWFTHAVHDSVYFIADDRVMRWADGRFRIWRDIATGHASLTGDQLYVSIREGTRHSVVTFAGDSMVTVCPLDNANKYKAFLPRTKQGLLVIDYQGRMYTTEKRGDPLVPINKTIDAFTYSTSRLTNGDYVLGTITAGVYVIDRDGNIKAHYRKEDGLSSNFLVDVFVDAEGDLWLATDNGVTRLEIGSPLRVLESDVVDDVNDLTFFNNALYIATNSGVVRLTRDTRETPARPQFKKIAGLEELTFVCKPVGDDMLVMNARGIYALKPGNQVEQIPPVEVGGRSIVDPPAGEETVFFGLVTSAIGSLTKTKGHWQRAGANIPITGTPMSMVQRDNGNIFIGTAHNGVCEIAWTERKKTHLPTDTYSLIHYDTTCGLPSMETQDVALMRGSINVTIPGWGLYSYDTVSQLFKFDSATVKAIPYAGATPGVPMVGASATSEFWLPVGHNSRTHIFRFADGVLKEHPLIGRFAEANIGRILDGGEVVLISTQDAIIAYDYREPFDGSNRFATTIRQVLINRDSAVYNGRLKENSAGFTIDYLANNLRFQFALPSYDVSGENQYQYFLEGFDHDWSAWSRERQVDFTNLREGDYIFHVRGKNIYGDVSGEDQFTFTILPPWYRTVWAYGIYGLLFLGVIAAAVSWRSENLRREKAALERTIAERTEEISQQAGKLAQQTERLKEMDQIKSNFFANISHEFRTPLTLIKGPVEQWLRRPERGLTRDEGEMIYRNSDRLLQLVNQLLDLSKIDAGSLQVENKAGDLEAFLRAISSSFTSLAEHRQLEYVVEVAAAQPFGLFDRDKLEKIVYNLLSNAFKFTPAGGRVTFRANFEKAELTLQVIDTGEGIGADSLPHIFDRFYQAGAQTGGISEGTGVGLALVKEVVYLLHGTIAVASEPGRGAQFTVRLPVMETTMADVDEQYVATHVTTPAEDRTIVHDDITPDISQEEEKETLLIVEDNPDMRAFIRDQLAGEFNVLMAVQGEEGLVAARREVPDLIITDLMMPVMDGMAFCAAIRSDEKTSHIPVIMLTARADRDSKLSGLETGADDYLTKPFDASELRARVHNLLTQRRQLRKKFSQQIVLQNKDVFITSMDSRFLEKMEATIEQNLSEADFGVAQLQDALAMSKTQLHRKMKALTGEAPGDYLRAYRLKRAAQLLKKQSGNITDVAFATGFASQSYFTKAFRAYYGQSPSEYIRDKRGGS